MRDETKLIVRQRAIAQLPIVPLSSVENDHFGTVVLHHVQFALLHVPREVDSRELAVDTHYGAVAMVYCAVFAVHNETKILLVVVRRRFYAENVFFVI